ncbi:hypothetical protein HDV04_001020 [Boothiomyces sp. JEL0838]|nr:hypothetical protein HDV04_001020 [Boothiomyces sp. JEL0838]
MGKKKLTRNLKTFFITTGMFPQEFILTLPQERPVKKIIISSRKVQEWVISYQSENQYKLFAEQVLEDLDGIQTCVIEPGKVCETRQLKFCILKGHDAFASVHRLVVYDDK